MGKFKLVVFVGATLGLLTFGWSMPAIVRAAPQIKCPVLGNAIDKKVFVDYQGKRIYFCCSGCIARFNKEPLKYLQKMEQAGIVPEKTS